MSVRFVQVCVCVKRGEYAESKFQRRSLYCRRTTLKYSSSII